MNIKHTTGAQIAAIAVTVIAGIVLLSMGIHWLWPDAPVLLGGLGGWLLAAFSWAAIYVPLWLLCLAALIILPGMNLFALYFLCASLLPFLILAAYARVTSNPTMEFASWPLLAAIGLPAIQTTLAVAGGLSIVLIGLGAYKLRRSMIRASGTGRGTIQIMPRQPRRSPSGPIGDAAGVQIQDTGSKSQDRISTAEDASIRPSQRTQARGTQAAKPVAPKGKGRGKGFDPYAFDPATIDIRLPRLPDTAEPPLPDQPLPPPDRSEASGSAQTTERTSRGRKEQPHQPRADTTESLPPEVSDPLPGLPPGSEALLQQPSGRLRSAREIVEMIDEIEFQMSRAGGMLAPQDFSDEQSTYPRTSQNAAPIRPLPVVNRPAPSAASLYTELAGDDGFEDGGGEPESADSGIRHPETPDVIITAPQDGTTEAGTPETQERNHEEPIYIPAFGRVFTKGESMAGEGLRQETDPRASASGSPGSDQRPAQGTQRHGEASLQNPRARPEGTPAAPASSTSGQGSASAGKGQHARSAAASPTRGATPHEPSKPHGGEAATIEPGEDSILLGIPGSGSIEFTSVPPSPGAKASSLTPILPENEAETRRRPTADPSRGYEVPVDGILSSYPDGQYWLVDEKTLESSRTLQATLKEFNIDAEVTNIRKGPVITMFEILPAPGVKLSRITNLGDNIALSLAASSVRIVAPIPGKHAVGIEVPNAKRAIVSLREIVDNENFKSARMEIPVALGKDIAGEVKFIDLASTPHLLIAGATGSGKSVCVNTIILSILYRRPPEDLRLLLIDPKIVELKLYNDIPHLLTPVVTEPKRAFQALQYCLCEMERRYSMLDLLGVRDIRSYNRRIREKSLAQEKLPYIVVIVDEFADLMATTGKELEATLARLAAMSRAVGIHLVLATQRPSIDVITGLIKANIPSRIAFMVAGKFDSRIIIDMVGAEKLLGKGDMLYSGATDPFPVRIQGAFVSDEEVERAVEYVKTLGEPEYIDDEIFVDEEDEESEGSIFDDGNDDPLFEKALEIVLQQGKASASYIQRRLKVGYNRAARLVELMEQRGIVGPAQGSKPRDLVRNPEVAGRINMTGDSPGRPGRPESFSDPATVRETRPGRSGGSAKEAGSDEDADVTDARGNDEAPPPGGTAGRAPGRRRPPLIPNLETRPGQRVTGKDED